MKKLNLFFVLLFIAIVCVGCKEEVRQGQYSNNLTAGQAKTRIVNGVTTQSEILEFFGAPNIVSKNVSGNEVWTYDKVRIEKASRDEYWNILVAGKGKDKQIVSTKTFTLMIEFDNNDIVKDNSYRASQF